MHLPLRFVYLGKAGELLKDKIEGQTNMVIRVNNSNKETAEMQSGQLRDILLRVRKARKDVEAEGIKIPLSRVEMHVYFQEEKCEAAYYSPESFLYITHKIGDLDAFTEEVSDIFRIIAGGKEDDES